MAMAFPHRMQPLDESEDEVVTAMTDHHGPPPELDDYIAKRRAGMSYREIAALHGTTAGSIRRAILIHGGPDAPLSSRAQRRRAEVAAVTKWLEENGPVNRDRIKEVFGYNADQINNLVRDGAPRHLIIYADRTSTGNLHAEGVPDDEVFASLRRAWSAALEDNPSARGLSTAVYDEYRDPENDLSTARIVMRYGWAAACASAGVPSGGKGRGTYTSRWTRDQVVAVIADYLDWCAENQKRPTYGGYDTWQRGRPDAPSGTMARIRMQTEEGLGSWPLILDYVQRTAPDGGKL